MLAAAPVTEALGASQVSDGCEGEEVGVIAGGFESMAVDRVEGEGVETNLRAENQSFLVCPTEVVGMLMSSVCK